MELSSWQLQAFNDHQISPHIAVFTSLYPDHLNVYPSMKEYTADKQAIYRWQNHQITWCLNREIPESQSMAGQVSSQLRWFSADDILPT
jgi:UDP-N-acetylmuramoylalanine-D-glutamate ligase